MTAEEQKKLNIEDFPALVRRMHEDNGYMFTEQYNVSAYNVWIYQNLYISDSKHNYINKNTLNT